MKMYVFLSLESTAYKQHFLPHFVLVLQLRGARFAVMYIQLFFLKMVYHAEPSFIRGRSVDNGARHWQLFPCAIAFLIFLKNGIFIDMFETLRGMVDRMVAHQQRAKAKRKRPYLETGTTKI